MSADAAFWFGFTCGGVVASIAIFVGLAIASRRKALNIDPDYSEAV